MSTIYDVAKLADVSIKTVSRVLNQEQNVRPATREIVLGAIKTLRFRPNMAARRLAGGRTFLLGILMHNATSGYLGGLQHGATARCREDGFHLVVEPVTPGQRSTEAQVRALCADLRVEGLILTPPICDAVALLDTLEELAVPYVRVAPGSQPERAPRVEIDDRAAAAAMTQFLIQLGHRDIGFVAGPADHGAALRRSDGLCDALADAGLQITPDWMVRGDFSFRSGVAAARTILTASHRPSAIFAANDDMALGVISAAHRMGLEVPRDLSVAGFDDTPAAESFLPALTTVHQPIIEMGRAAADLLITRAAIGGELDVQVRLQSTPVIRSSAIEHGLSQLRSSADPDDVWECGKILAQSPMSMGISARCEAS